MQILLKLPSHDALTTSERRIQIAVLIAATINGGTHREMPYQATPGNDYHFVVDVNNDWWMDVERDDTSLIRLTHRYFDHSVMVALSYWIAYRLRAKIVIKNDDDTGTVTITGRNGIEAITEVVKKAEALLPPVAA